MNSYGFSLQSLLFYIGKIEIANSMLNIYSLRVNLGINNYTISRCLKVGGERSVLLPWSSAEVSRNVSECTSSPCQPNPCSNGAICRLKQDTIVFCLCMLGFYGDRCQKSTYYQLD